MTELFCFEARGYEQLQVALRARAEQLNVSREKLDEISGLPAGYCGKLLAPDPIKNLGPIAMGALLGALGLKMMLVDDHEALAYVERRLVPRDSNQARLHN